MIELELANCIYIICLQKKDRFCLLERHFVTRLMSAYFVMFVILYNVDKLTFSHIYVNNSDFLYSIEKADLQLARFECI